MFDKIKENFQHFLVIWLVVIIANQVLFFGGCLKLYCLAAAIPHTLVIALFISYLWFKSEEKDAETNDSSSTEEHYRTSRPKPKLKPKQRPPSDLTSSSASKWKQANAEDDVLKKRGDGYELHIGRKFELKGDLVIYNGFIRGYEDQGVDIIVISRREKSVYLIQCKHWRRYEFTAWHLKKIYDKLNNFIHDYQNIDPDTINKYFSIKYEKTYILESIHNANAYQIRKTLYLSNSSVIQSDVWHLLNKINDNIYRYQDMKVVIHGI